MGFIVLSILRPALISSIAVASLAGLAVVGSVGTPAASAPSTVTVSPTGSDAAAGTLGAPLRTIQAAILRLPGGGTVDLRGGRYFQKIDLTGTTGITVAAHRNESVVLDGSRFTPPDGRSAMVTLKNSSHVTLRGLEITNYRTSNIAAMPIGIYIHGAGDHVLITDDHVHDLGNDNQTLGSFDINAHGIAAYGDDPDQSIRDLTISRNTVDHLALGASETVVVNGNVVGWSITDNWIHDNNNIGIDAIGFESTLPGKDRYTETNRARNGIIAGNRVSLIRSQGNPSYWQDGAWCDCADGIYVDGGTHIDIHDNVVTGNDIGIEVAAENARGSADFVMVRSNTVTDSLYVGITTGGYCDGGDDCGGVKTGTSHDNTFVGNTLRDNNKLNDGSPELLIQYYARNNLFEHNAVTATNSAGAVVGTVARAASDKISGGNVSDSNSFAVAGTSKVSFGWLGASYPSFAAYTKATRQDVHSSFALTR